MLCILFFVFLWGDCNCFGINLCNNFSIRQTMWLDDPNHSRQSSKCTADVTIKAKVGAGLRSELAQLQNEWPFKRLLL